ncbi:MAG: hypothetical protein L0229_27920 [Blastocatellia bacterium]|nr:hypothetical protein [Blastocatellia bacterium]
MKLYSLKLIAIALVMACALFVLLGDGETSSGAEKKYASTGFGNAETLMARYQAWEAKYVKEAGAGNIALPLGPSMTFSTEYVAGSGQAKINLHDGKVEVSVEGLPRDESWDVWLIDELNGPGSSILPEPGDTMMNLGSLKQEGEQAKLETTLDPAMLPTLDPDVVVVTRKGKNPTESRTLAGNMTLFHELYLSGQQGHFGTINDRVETPSQEPEERGLFGRMIDAISPTASAQIGPGIGGLIGDGRKLFFNEQFLGNGRTCGTCHREDNNLTIDPEFMATLPPSDALFVAEFNPNLAVNFENPVLMRNFGLILENVDGFGNLATKFAMRGVPHTLALLDNTLTPANFDGTTTPPNERTGWSGDGAPVGLFTLFDGTPHNAQGTLLDFAIGAVIQHFPRTLNRQPFTFPGLPFDFRLPTLAELVAMEAFQKSTGRRLDPDLSVLVLKGFVPDRGQQLFLSVGCNLCHRNAGASVDNIQNANFNTGVENLPDQPADLTGELNPPDGGFGQTPCTGPGGSPPCGNGTFNTPVVVEAADTGPFFHNNAIETIEGAVDFYDSNAFNNSPAGQIVPIDLEATQVVAIAAFLRVLNTLENIRSAGDLEKRAILANLADGRELIGLSIAELTDALEVLNGGGLHPNAQLLLQQAIALDTQARRTSNLTTRNNLLNQALDLKKLAVKDMVAVNVPAFDF